MFPQLTLNICATTIFQQAVMDPPELQFFSSPGLSNNSYNCANACEVIALNKAFDIFSEAYCFDTPPASVHITEVVDKIASCYFRLPLAWADNFYRAQVKHEIARLDIVITQAANQAFVHKVTLGCIRNRKAKRFKQLEITAVIKNNNLQMEAIIAKEQADLDRMYPQSTKKTSPDRETSIYFLRDQAQKTQGLINTEDDQTYMIMMMMDE